MSDGISTVLPAINPATGQVVGETPVTDAAGVASSVEAAATAADEWAATDFRDRASIVLEWAERVSERADEIARTEAADAGIPITIARSDVRRAIARMRYFAGLIWELKGTTFPAGRDAFVYSVREPFGVVAVITPYNHPALFALSKLAAPLLTGNTVVIKPPEQASLSTAAIVELLPRRAPAGLVRVVTGDGTTGQALVNHPEVRKISFTGSVPTGRAIMADASRRIVPVVLELGGKNAMIVLPDAPFEEAISGAVNGMALGVCGQSCQSATRLFVHQSISERFVEALQARLPRVRIGDPLASETEMGPLISGAQRDRVLGFVAAAKSEGARLVYGGSVPALDGDLAAGFFVEPTVFDQVHMGMTIAQQEVFGPVLSVFTWNNVEEMLAQVNALELGLTASVWTTSMTAISLPRRIEAGYVYVNQHGGTSEGAPFGGWKQSGLGTEHSLDELYEFTRVKTVDARLAS